MTPSVTPPATTPGTLPKSAENADHESLAQERVRRLRRDREDDAEETACGPRQRRTEPERDGIDAADLDPHQQGRFAVHAHGDNGAAGPRRPQQAVQESDESKRKGHADQSIGRNHDAAHMDRSKRRRQDDFAEIGFEGQDHQIVQHQVETEGQRQGDEHRTAHDAIDDGGLDGVAETEQQQCRHRHKQEGIDVQILVGEKCRIRSENDQRSMQDIDDVEHAPDEREADGDGAVEAAKHQPIHQYLDVQHCKPRSQGIAVIEQISLRLDHAPIRRGVGWAKARNS